MAWLLPNAIVVLCLGSVLYALGVAIYRRYFSDLAHFPGPKLAAVTYWYEFYYDAWPHQGQYEWKIRDLHAKYGELFQP